MIPERIFQFPPPPPWRHHGVMPNLPLGERPMRTTSHGGKGSKGRTENGDRAVGAASCRREQYTMASCQPPPPRTWMTVECITSGLHLSVF